MTTHKNKGLFRELLQYGEMLRESAERKIEILVYSEVCARPRISIPTLKRSSVSVILYAMALLVFFIEPVQGYLVGGDHTKAGTNLIAMASICLMSAIAFVSPIYRTQLLNKKNIIIVFLSSFSLFYILTTGAAKGAVSNDFFALSRSLVFGFFVFNLCKIIPNQKRKKTLLAISISTWLFISLSILIGSKTGIGLYAYIDQEAGYRFYYPSINELNFVFFSSFLINFIFSKKIYVKLIYFAITIGTYLVLGSKSFVALLFITFISYFFIKTTKTNRFIFFIILTLFSFLFFHSDIGTEFSELILLATIHILTEYSSGSAKFIEKLSYLEPFTALVSERDVLFTIATEIYRYHYGLFETLFGIGLSSYGSVYGPLRGNSTFSYSEMDPVDLFMSYGISGLIITIIILIFIFRKKTELGNETDLARRLLVITFIATGTLTGHIYLMGFPVFYFAIYAGLCSPRYKKEKYK